MWKETLLYPTAPQSLLCLWYTATYLQYFCIPTLGKSVQLMIQTSLPDFLLTEGSLLRKI